MRVFVPAVEGEGRGARGPISRWNLERSACAVLVLMTLIAPTASGQDGFGTQAIDCSKVEMFLDLSSGEISGTVNSMTICPANSRKIALMVDTNRGELNVWLVDTDTGEKIKVSSGSSGEEDLLGTTKAKDKDACWCPIADQRGRLWFAFVGLGDTGEPGIFVGWFGGSRVCRIVDGVPGIGWLRWSPDGTEIVFNGADEDGGGPRIYLIDGLDAVMAKEDPGDIQLRTPRRLTGYASMYPDWSPDGKYIAYAGEQSEMATLLGGTPASNYRNWGIMVIDPSEPDKVGLMTDSMQDTDEYRPTWSPDGDYIAFQLTREQEPIDSESKAPREKFRTIELQVLRVVQSNCRVARGQVLEGSFPIEKNLIQDDIMRGPIWGPAGSYTLFYIPMTGAVPMNPFAQQPIRYCKVLPWQLKEPKDTYDAPIATGLEYTSILALDRKGERAAFTITEGLVSSLYTMSLSGEDLLPVELQARGVDAFTDLIGQRIDAPCRKRWTNPKDPAFWYAGSGTAAVGGAALVTVWCPWCPPPAGKDLLKSPPYPGSPTSR